MKKNLKFVYATLQLIFLMVIVVSCIRDNQEAETEFSVRVYAEGPLYEGSNTATGIWQVNLGELFPEHDLRNNTIKSARIESVVIEYAPEFPVKNLKVELTGRNVDMQKIAFANNIPQGETKPALIVANEQKKIEKFLALDQVTVVADVDLAEDLDDNFSALVKFKLIINY